MWEKPGSTGQFDTTLCEHATPKRSSMIRTGSMRRQRTTPSLFRPGFDNLRRFPHLPVVQQPGAACTLAAGQPIGTFFVKPMHPVPQCLAGPFRQSAPPPFGSCHRRQQPMPEVVVSGGCLNITAQDSASWQHQDHGEGVQQQAWQICFAGVNHKINERGNPPEPEFYEIGMSGLFAGDQQVHSDFNESYVTGWDVSRVKDMSSMFANTDTFDQDIGGWDISSLTDAYHMLGGSGMSQANFNRLLAGWRRLTRRRARRPSTTASRSAQVA